MAKVRCQRMWPPGQLSPPTAAPKAAALHTDWYSSQRSRPSTRREWRDFQWWISVTQCFNGIYQWWIMVGSWCVNVFMDLSLNHDGSRVVNPTRRWCGWSWLKCFGIHLGMVATSRRFRAIKGGNRRTGLPTLALIRELRLRVGHRLMSDAMLFGGVLGMVRLDYDVARVRVFPGCHGDQRVTCQGRSGWSVFRSDWCGSLQLALLLLQQTHCCMLLLAMMLFGWHLQFPIMDNDRNTIMIIIGLLQMMDVSIYQPLPFAWQW